MKLNQKLKASDGYEVMLFPLEYMYISQGEGGSYSHNGVLAMDFLGYNNSGVVPDCPMYAPCSCKCVATIDVDNKGRIFESLNKVHTPNGLEYVTFMCFHDENPIADVGDIFIQGELFAHTGMSGNVTGDHTHFNTAVGKYAGWENVPPENNGQLINSSHIYDTCYVNDTIIVEGLSYNWKTFTGLIKRNKFKWVLYAKKLRNKSY